MLLEGVVERGRNWIDRVKSSRVACGAPFWFIAAWWFNKILSLWLRWWAPLPLFIIPVGGCVNLEIGNVILAKLKMLVLRQSTPQRTIFLLCLRYTGKRTSRKKVQFAHLAGFFVSALNVRRKKRNFPTGSDRVSIWSLTWEKLQINAWIVHSHNLSLAINFLSG